LLNSGVNVFCGGKGLSFPNWGRRVGVFHLRGGVTETWAQENSKTNTGVERPGKPHRACVSSRTDVVHEFLVEGCDRPPRVTLKTKKATRNWGGKGPTGAAMKDFRGGRDFLRRDGKRPECSSSRKESERGHVAIPRAPKRGRVQPKKKKRPLGTNSPRTVKTGPKMRVGLIVNPSTKQRGKFGHGSWRVIDPTGKKNHKKKELPPRCVSPGRKRHREVAKTWWGPGSWDNLQAVRVCSTPDTKNSSCQSALIGDAENWPN